MNEILRDRLLRKLDALPDDKAYQVLDYVEFLESKYAERPAGAPPFQRVAAGKAAVEEAAKKSADKDKVEETPPAQ